MSSKCAKIHQTLLVDPSVNVLNLTDEMFVRPNESCYGHESTKEQSVYKLPMTNLVESPRGSSHVQI